MYVDIYHTFSKVDRSSTKVQSKDSLTRQSLSVISG